MKQLNAQQSKALSEIIKAIVQTISECPTGAPAGPIYAALMAHGCTLNQFESLMGGLERVGVIRKQGDLYFSTK